MIPPQIAQESYRENQIQQRVFTQSGPEPDQSSVTMLQCGTPANVGHWPRRTRPEARPNANCGQLRATLWFSGGRRGSGVDDCE